MNDLVIAASLFGFGLLTWGLIVLCERLGNPSEGGRR
jgi:hypothetical protein